MKINQHPLLTDVLIIAPDMHYDYRGKFYESFRTAEYEALLDCTFIQENISVSRRGVIRGLHYQKPKVQGKLLTVVYGKIFDVFVDLRKGSPTFKKGAGVTLNSKENCQIWIPPGFAHGFQALRDGSIIQYKCTDIYDPTGEHTIRFDDADLRIEWPIKVNKKYISGKDRSGKYLSQLRDEELFVYHVKA